MKKILYLLIVFTFLMSGISYGRRGSGSSAGSFKLNFKNGLPSGYRITRIFFVYTVSSRSGSKTYRKHLTAADLNVYSGKKDHSGLHPTHAKEIVLDGIQDGNVKDNEKINIKVDFFSVAAFGGKPEKTTSIDWFYPMPKLISSGDTVVIQKYAVDYGVYRYRVQIGGWLSTNLTN